MAGILRSYCVGLRGIKIVLRLLAACAAMAPKKRPAKGVTEDGKKGDGEDAGTSNKSRVGFKNVDALATALAPYVTDRFFTTYTTNRSQKSVDKSKLLSKPTCQTTE